MEHVNSLHVDDFVRCHLCKFVTINEDKLKEHEQQVHDESAKYYNCSHCSYKAIHESDLRIHNQTFHDNQAFVLKVLQDFAVTIRALSTDILSIKANSIIIEKDVFQNIKGDIVDEINQNVAQKFEKIEDKLTSITNEFKILKKDFVEKEDATTPDKDENAPTEKKNKSYAGATKAPAEAPQSESIKPKSKTQSVTWFGTSISKVLDKTKFEEDTNTKLKVVKAYCIEKEGRFPDANFCDIVPNELKTKTADVAVFQPGSIEITNLEVKEAMMDHTRDINEYEKEWSAKVEKDSENLFNLALKVTKENPELTVVILKRLPRFDSKAKDPTGIKSKLSNFANNVYDHLFFKHGCPKNIKISFLQLDLNSPHLQKIVMGKGSVPYDGLHCNGSDASRHFTYRSVQM